MLRAVVPLFALAALAACETPAPAAPAPSETTRKIESSLLDAARTAEQRRDHQTAASYYRGVYERDPTSLEGVLGLSRSLRQLARPKEARAVVERAIVKRPQDAALLAELGKAQLGADAALDAIESLSKADALRPGDWEVNSALGVAYDRTGMYDQAERRYREALGLSPDNVTVLNNLGLSLAQSGRLSQGVDALERASSLPESTPQVRQNLALLYAMKGDLKATERLVRRDLSGELAEQNLAYYRRLSASLRAGGPTPLPNPIVGGAESPPIVAPPPLAPVAVAPRPPDPVSPPPPAPPTPMQLAVETPRDKAPAATDKAPAADSKAPAAERKVPPAEQASPPADDKAPPAPEKTPSAPQAPAQAAPPVSPKGSEAVPPPAPQPAMAALRASEPGAPPAQRAAAPGAPAFRVQLGSFPTAENAELGSGQIRKRHADLLAASELQIVKGAVPDRGEVWRVVTAPASGYDAARALCESFRIRGADCILVRLP